MSEFYTLRRTRITDAFALAGFIIGLLYPALSAGRRMAEGFELGDAIGGVAQFVFSTLAHAIAGGLIGLVVGLAAGRVWEAVHRLRRKPAASDELSWPAATGASAGNRAVAERGHATAVAAAAPQAPAPGITFSQQVPADEYVALAARALPATLDVMQVEPALAATTNIGAYAGARLVGSARLLTDGHFFATVPEVMVDPEFRRRGIGRELMLRALDASAVPVLVFGVPPASAGFFERIGCQRAPSGYVMRRRTIRATGT